MTRIPSASAPEISGESASASIIVPVGLAGLAITTPLSGVRWCAAMSALGDSAQRVCALSSLDGRRRCRRRRLTYLHMNDVGPLSLALCGGSHHVHDDERRHLAAFGRFQELFCLLEHRFSVRRAPCPAPLLPHSADCLRTWPASLTASK